MYKVLGKGLVHLSAISAIAVVVVVIVTPGEPGALSPSLSTSPLLP